MYITKTKRKERNGICTSGLFANLAVKTWTRYKKIRDDKYKM
jgi:hypothetical protein